MKIEKKHWILLAIAGVVFIVWYLTKSKKGSAKLGTNGIAPIAYTPGSENQTLLDRLKNIKLQQKLSGLVSGNSYVKDGAESSFNKGIKNTIVNPTPNYLWRATGGRVMKYMPGLNSWFYGRRYLQKNGQWGTTHISSSNDLVLGNSDKVIGVPTTTLSGTFLMIHKIILGQPLSNGLQQIDFQLFLIGQWNFPNQSVQYTYPIINIGYQPWEGQESSFNKDITCKKCDWSWNKEDSQANDLYTCHKCGYDNSNNESSFGQWKPDVVSPASQLKSVMNIDPLNNSIFATPLKHESSFRGGGGHGGGGHGRHHGGRGGFGRWGGYGFGYPVYDTIGFGIPYDYYNEPVVINAAKCPEGFFYRGQKDGCKSISEIVK